MEFENRIDLSELQMAAEKIRKEIGKILVGQNQMVDHFLVAILTNGHILIEGVPGVAKTLTAKLMARTLSIDFSRIQFTPDLMPSDVLGTSVYNQAKSEFEFKKGPIFSNIILIDEINRAPAKTQAALFEVMEERQITSDGTTYKMQAPFLVFATQNPIEQEGTYRLPEAQLDRFVFKVEVDYPSLEEEISILDNFHEEKNIMDLHQVEAMLTAEQLISFQETIKDIHVEPSLRKYIAEITNKTRNNRMLYLGASPRASIAIMQAPFLVFATQNPIEQEGTYRLPEAQLDRFVFKVEVDYPSLEEEISILDNFHEEKNIMDLHQVEAMLTAEQLISFQETIKDIHVEPSLRKYIAEITNKTRNNRMLYLGASPRASIAIMQSSKALAAIRGRDFVTPEDIQEMVEPVLVHRILLTAEKEMEGATPRDIIRQIVKSVEIPR